MKLKLALFVTAALAGGGASVALADHGGDGGHGRAAKCQEIHLTGTLAAQALSVAVTKANHHGPAAGTTVSVAVPAGTRVTVEACETGTGTAATFTLRGAELHFKAPKPTTTNTTTTSTTTNP